MIRLFLNITFLFLLSASLTFAQFDILNKVKDKVEKKVEEKIDEGIDKTIDDAVDGNNEAEESVEKNSEEIYDNEEKQTSETAKTEELKSFTKYDFVPGDQVLFFEDFSQDAIGDFPALWTTDGSGEVRTTNLYPGNFFYMNASGKVYNLMKDLELPKNFIFEFDVIPTSEYEEGGGSHSFYLTLYNDDDDWLNNELYPGKTGVHLTVRSYDWDVIAYSSEIKTKDGYDYNVNGGSDIAPVQPNKLNHVIIWVQNRRFRVYHTGQKVLDMPTLIPENTTFNRLRFSLWSQDGHPYISNIRFTTASPDMRSKLLTEGKIVSHGIYFDSGSDKIKPESYGTLKEIAKVLTENPDVKIKIVGHTDSDGADDLNLELSKKRAASVKTALTNDFGIDASRMETDGMGESQPISGNNTPEEKANNRRVEFIKL